MRERLIFLREKVNVFKPLPCGMGLILGHLLVQTNRIEKPGKYHLHYGRTNIVAVLKVPGYKADFLLYVPNAFSASPLISEEKDILPVGFRIVPGYKT